MALGYLSVLLVTLSLDVDIRTRVQSFRGGRGLVFLISTAEEFLQYHRKVDQEDAPGAEGSAISGSTMRLQQILAKLRETEDAS